MSRPTRSLVDPPELVVVPLSEVEPERVVWLWPGRIPLGKLTVLDGDPGLGKSTMLLDIIARLTTGRAMPDGAPCEPGNVVLLTAEDGLGDTVRPRVDAAGGDVSRVSVFKAVVEDGEERLPSFPQDAQALESLVTEKQARLIVVDPLSAYLGNEINSWRDHDVRRALAPLAALAEKTGAAIVVVRHLSKRAGGPALYRGGGSIGIIGAARSGLLVAADPDNDEQRVLASLKCNLSRRPQSLTFKLEEVSEDLARVVWLGESDHGANSLLRAAEDAGEGEQLSEAVALLRGELADGSKTAKELFTSAREAGVSERTLRRAADRLRVQKERMGFGPGGRWVWRLPIDAQVSRKKSMESIESMSIDDHPEHGGH